MSSAFALTLTTGKITIKQKQTLNMVFVVVALIAAFVIGRNVLSHRQSPETLIEAIKHGDPARVHEILKAGTDPNGKDGSPMKAALNHFPYKTPELSQAISARMVTELIGAGARFNLEECLGLANRLGDQVLRRQIANYFYDANNTGESHMVTLARMGDVAMFKQIIGHGGSVNQSSLTGTTPLIAASQGSLEMVKTVLQYHPDVNAKDHEGNTSLMRAAALCRLENLKILLQFGADPTAKNKRGETALDLGKKWHNAELEALLKNMGAKPVSPP